MASLLLLVLFLQTFSKAVTYVDFCVNRDYIARNLCENRDKPMMHCGGRCVLCKRLARQDNEDKSNPEKKEKETIVLLFCKAWPDLSFEGGDRDILRYTLAFSDTRTFDRPSFCFQPPD